MDNYKSGFVLDFAYCKNCHFHAGRKGVSVQALGTTELKERLVASAEIAHDNRNKIHDFPCEKRELVISFNRVMIEI